jgi:hypothetical protein
MYFSTSSRILNASYGPPPFCIIDFEKLNFLGSSVRKEGRWQTTHQYTLTVAICAWENAKPQFAPSPPCPFLLHIKAHGGKPNVITVYNRGGFPSFPRRFHQFLCSPSIRKFLRLTASNDRVMV